MGGATKDAVHRARQRALGSTGAPTGGRAHGSDSARSADDHLRRLPQPFGRAEAIVPPASAPGGSSALPHSGQLTRIATGLYAVRAPWWTSLAPWVRHELLARAAVRLTPDAIVSHVSRRRAAGTSAPGIPDHEGDDDAAGRRTHQPQRRVAAVPSRRDAAAARPHHRWPRPTSLRPGPSSTAHASSIPATHWRSWTQPCGCASRPSVICGPMRRHQRGWPGIAEADVLLGWPTGCERTGSSRPPPGRCTSAGSLSACRRSTSSIRLDASSVGSIRCGPSSVLSGRPTVAASTSSGRRGGGPPTWPSLMRRSRFMQQREREDRMQRPRADRHPLGPAGGAGHGSTGGAVPGSARARADPGRVTARSAACAVAAT